MELRNHLELIFLAAIWGASFLFMRIASPEFGPFALIEIRLALASLVLLPIWWQREGKAGLAQVRANWWRLLIVGILNSALPFVMFAYAALYITGGFASILNSTATIWAAVVAWIWLGQTPTRSVTLGLLLGVIGVVLLVSNKLSWPLSNSAIGVLAAAAAASLYGVAANYTGEKLSHVSSMTIATWSLVGGSVFLLPFALWHMPNGEISAVAWYSVIAMGVVSTAVANILYFHLIAIAGGTRATTVAFMIPVFAMIWGAIFIDEQVTLIMLVGTGIILLATALVTRLIRLPANIA